MKYILIFLLTFSVSLNCKSTFSPVIRDPKTDPLYKLIPDSMKSIHAELTKVLDKDQAYRQHKNEKLYLQNISKQDILDLENQPIVFEFLKKYGWPSLKMVGYYGKEAILGTCLHADAQFQLTVYPYLASATLKSPALVEELTSFEDRLNSNLHRYQLYGNQFVNYKGKLVPYPIGDFGNFQNRRDSMGLITNYEVYAQTLGTTWDSESYKLILPDLVKSLNITDSPSISTAIPRVKSRIKDYQKIKALTDSIQLKMLHNTQKN